MFAFLIDSAERPWKVLKQREEGGAWKGAGGSRKDRDSPNLSSGRTSPISISIEADSLEPLPVY